jgi:hypothetical protein
MTSTGWLILIVLIFLGVWDVAVWVTGWAPTISATIRTWASWYPWLPFLLALLTVVLFFHLFVW